MVLEAALWRSSNDVITRLAKGCPWRVARGTGAFLLGSFSNAVNNVQETVRNQCTKSPSIAKTTNATRITIKMTNRTFQGEIGNVP